MTRVGMWARPLTLPGVFVRRRNFVSGATARTKFHFSRSRDESKERERGREGGREGERERNREREMEREWEREKPPCEFPRSALLAKEVSA